MELTLGNAEVFAFELSQIKDDKTREFTIRAINELPQYFFQIPASSSSKYHPISSLGEGGLLKHVKSAVGIALELFKCESCYSFTEEEQDIIISALLLHDGLKGFPHTMFTHPLMIVAMIRRNEEVTKCIDKLVLDKIFKAIESHMGQWCTSSYSAVVLPKPNTKIQRFVHMVDYLASRKCIEINFDAETKRNDL